MNITYAASRDPSPARGTLGGAGPAIPAHLSLALFGGAFLLLAILNVLNVLLPVVHLILAHDAHVINHKTLLTGHFLKVCTYMNEIDE